jgi:hypothetical protein
MKLILIMQLILVRALRASDCVQHLTQLDRNAVLDGINTAHDRVQYLTDLRWRIRMQDCNLSRAKLIQARINTINHMLEYLYIDGDGNASDEITCFPRY